MFRSLLLLPWLLLVGCASVPKNAAPRPANLFPADTFQTHRVVLTALGKQYTFNGYLALSQTGGKRLIVMENFGNVLADVLIKPDGEIFVMKSSKAFTEKQIRRFLASDVETIFGDDVATHWPVRVVETNHFLLKKRWYRLDLRVVGNKPGPQPAAMFDETKALKP